MQKNFPEYKNYLADLVRKFGAAQPTVMGPFSQLHKAALHGGEGAALNPKIRELMALAIGIAGRCEGCIAFHTADALKAGATRAEVLETISVAVMMGGGPALVYGCEALAALDQFSSQ
jgi:AhpD family alkylhydroperoxidase